MERREHGNREDQLGAAADAAGRALVTDGQYDWATRELGEEPWLLPAMHHIENVQLMGIARLLYRPKTGRTAAWYADQKRVVADWLKRYEEMAAAPDEGSKEASMQHQRLSTEISKEEHQRKSRVVLGSGPIKGIPKAGLA